MENVIQEAMKLARALCMKSCHSPLTEYEMLCCEQLNHLIQNFSKYHALLCEKHCLEAERDLLTEKQKHDQWLKEGDLDGDTTAA